MRAFLSLLLCVFGFGPSALVAQDRDGIGTGRLFTNDYIGDGRDRWRTGSYVFSHLRARVPFDGTAQPFGDIIEYRLRGEIIASQSGNGGAGVRPYVGALSLGIHTHFGLGVLDASIGADITAIGPQTGLDGLQGRFHERFSLPLPSRNNQLDNAVLFGGTAMISYDFPLGPNAMFRPFVEAQAGVEDVFRVGGDLLIGPVGQTDVLLRDVVTGQLYRGTQNAGNGVSLVLGADLAAVSGSVYLPEDDGFTPFDERTRARAGVQYQYAEDVTLFYGMTYLSEEFQGQPEGQVLGSVKLSFNF